MTHDASLIPSRWFPYWKPRFRRTFTSRWWLERIAKAQKVIVQIRERIQSEGALQASDFEATEPRAKGAATGWWEWRAEKAALEYLWRTGELAVVERRGFQKVYDLVERVLPEGHAAPEPDEAAHDSWACGEALARLGVATPGELAAFWNAVPVARAHRWCKAAVASGLAVPVRLDGRTAVALPDWDARAARARPAPAGMRLLSPFDPLVRDRRRALRLFGFDYRFEAFVPRAQRKFGYYVLPVLDGDRLVARLDPKLHRERGELEVLGLWWERRPTRAQRASLEEALDRFARFLGASRWSLPRGRGRA